MSRAALSSPLEHSLFIATCLLLTLPWLNPFSGGPTPAVLPLLFSWICLLAVLGGGPRAWACALAAAGGAWLLAALASAGMGLLQYFGLSEFFSPWISITVPGEAYGNLRQRNQFATLTNVGLAALLWWAAHQHRTAGRRRAEDGPAALPGARSPATFFGQLACGMAAALLAVGNAASSSRTGLVQLLVLLALAGVWAQWRRPAVRLLLFVAALAYVLASASLPWLAGLDASSTGILARLNDGGAACASRLTLWRNVLHLIGLKPWFGWGWGELDFAHFTTLYTGPRFCEILDNAHNLPLHLAVELGVPAALLVCGGGAWLIWRAKPWRERDATRQMAWSVLGLILLHSLLEYPLWYGPFQMAVLLCVGLLWPRPAGLGLSATDFIDDSNDAKHTTNLAAKYGSNDDATHGTSHDAKNTLAHDEKWSNKAFAHVLYRLFAILIIVTIIFAARDYHRVSQIYLPPEDRAPALRSNTLTKIQDTWLFQNQARFALLTITPLTSDNALRVNQLAHDLLHFSPEARVVEKLIDSALLLGRNDEARFYAARFRAAYPAEYDAWAQKNGVTW